MRNNYCQLKGNVENDPIFDGTKTYFKLSTAEKLTQNKVAMEVFDIVSYGNRIVDVSPGDRLIVDGKMTTKDQARLVIANDIIVISREIR